MSTLVTAIEIDAYDPSRSNLLAYSRQLDQVGTWPRGGLTSVTANAGSGADNQSLAELTLENAVNTDHYIQQTATATSNALHTLSVFVKRGTGTRNFMLTMYGANPANLGQGKFDLTAKSATLFTSGTASGMTAGIQQFDNGWFRCWLSGVPQSAAGATILCRLSHLSGTTVTYAGDGVSTLYMDRALLETGSTLGDFIETAATAGPGLKKLLYTDAERLVTGTTDTPPHTRFDRRVKERPNFVRRMFGDLRVLSSGQSSGGLIKLINTDSAMSSLLDLGMDGRDISIRVGYTTGAYPSSYTMWLKGTIDQPEVSDTECVLRLRDRMQILDLPLQSTKYAGTNTGAPLSGAEGVTTDIIGLPKPRCWGQCYHVPAVLVNTAKRTYQVNDGSVQAISNVYDKGVSVTAGADYANLALLEAAVPAAGTFITCLALGLFRMGDAAQGIITAHVQGDNTGGYVSRPGAIARRILESVAGVATADINTTSFSNLDTANNYECGVWFDAETTRRVAIEMVLTSVGAVALPNAAGTWTATQLVSPSGTAVATFKQAEIIAIDRMASNDAGNGIPAGEALLKYRKYWHAFSTADIAGSVAESTRGELLKQYRRSQTSDPAVKTAHLLYSSIDRDTVLTTAANADTERNRLMALYGVRRDFVKLRSWVNTTTAAIDLGSIVDVYTSRLGYNAGRKFIVIGITQEDNEYEFELWG